VTNRIKAGAPTGKFFSTLEKVYHGIDRLEKTSKYNYTPMRRLITILLLALTTFACKKEDSYTYSGIYISQRAEISAIRLFSKNGEISDQAKIQRYIKRADPNFFIHNYDTIIDMTNRIVIEFLPDKKATVTILNNSETNKVIEKNGIIYFESDQISTRYNFTADPFYDKIYTYFPFYYETIPLSSASGFYSKTEYKHCYYTKGQKEVIVFPLVSYMYTRDDAANNYLMEANWNVNNEFNEDSYQSFAITDTLAVQQIFVVIEK